MSDTCALGRNGARCLLDGEIRTLLEIYAKQIGGGKPPKEITSEQILLLLEKKTKCGTEECMICAILDAVRGTIYEPIVLRIKEMALKVDGPDELDALLDSFLIIRVCRQIAGNHPGVAFGGVLTADFMIPPVISSYGKPLNVWLDYAKSRWSQLQFILNIDHRMGVGQHWTALVVDSKKQRIDYFDSYAMPPPNGPIHGSRPYTDLTDKNGEFLSLLQDWIDGVRAIFAKNKLPLEFGYNRTSHQSAFDKSNCGPYSILFLLRRAAGETLEETEKKVVTTKEIEEMRGRIYRRTKDYVPIPPGPTR